MTTNVFDGAAGMVATDSRWSQLHGRWLVYVDDVAFNKIELYRNAAFVFAGKGHVVQKWKEWLASEPNDLDAMPDPLGISVCVIDVQSREVKYAERQDIVRDGAYFAGSGARFAFGCWDRNRDAVRSVDSAKKVDPATGGEVKFICLASGRNNLLGEGPRNRVTLAMVDKAIQERGMVMDLSLKRPGGPPFKLTDIAANSSAADDELRELKAKIERGEISAEAPCDSMHSEWTPDQKARLKAALKDVLGFKK